MKFKELGIKSEFVQALSEMKIENASEIQEKVIPFLLNNERDLIGKAQTGTGKTLAFGLPLLDKINPDLNKVQALILSPTRELGKQIAKQLFKCTKYSSKIFIEAVYGGEKIDVQIQRLSRPTHIIVATPGRLIELMQKNVINLNSVKTVVLDEADEMLTLGFKKELNEILDSMVNPKNTWLFSATISPEIKKIINNYLTDPMMIEVLKSKTDTSTIRYEFVKAEDDQKLYALTQFLNLRKEERGIIFCKTKATVTALTSQMQAKKLNADCIQGDMKQIDRDKVMRAFRSEKLQYLVATDISARGIDVADLGFVVHYQLPDQTEFFVHRSGRTGRAGKKGYSLAIVNQWEVNQIKEIEKVLKLTMNKI
jgi:ATP-dependent RNA helicase DeaD